MQIISADGVAEIIRDPFHDRAACLRKRRDSLQFAVTIEAVPPCGVLAISSRLPVAHAQRDCLIRVRTVAQLLPPIRERSVMPGHSFDSAVTRSDSRHVDLVPLLAGIGVRLSHYRAELRFTFYLRLGDGSIYW